MRGWASRVTQEGSPQEAGLALGLQSLEQGNPTDVAVSPTVTSLAGQTAEGQVCGARPCGRLEICHRPWGQPISSKGLGRGLAPRYLGNERKGHQCAHHFLAKGLILQIGKQRPERPVPLPWF